MLLRYVPLISISLQQNALQQSHDLPSAGHQGTAKTLAQCSKGRIGLEWQRTSNFIVGNAQHVNKLNQVGQLWEMLTAEFQCHVRITVTY